MTKTELMNNINFEYKTVEKKIGVTFDNKELLLTAFTHRSYLNEHRSVKEHNERLEFLGDAVLELITTEHLYLTYLDPEGVLTNWRSAVVKTESISEAAKELGFEEHLRLSRGEKKGTKRARQIILANSFEAVIGAIYLDKGYEVAKSFIEKNLLVKLPTIIETKAYIDPKSRFQELAQERDGVTPNYKVIGEEGPDHEKIFTIGAFIGEKLMGEGKGASKQAAEQVAAADALKKYTNS